MAGSGAPETGGVDASGLNIVVIAGTWHEVITDGLIAGAKRVLDATGATYRVVRVPGSFELPSRPRPLSTAERMPWSPSA